MMDLPEEMIRATVYGNQEDSIRLLEAGAKEIKQLRKKLEDQPPPPPPRIDPGFCIGGWRDEDEFRLRRTGIGKTVLEQKRVFRDGTVRWRKPEIFSCIYFKGKNA